MVSSLLASLPLSCHVLLKKLRRSWQLPAFVLFFFRSALLRRSEMLLSIELLMNFLVTFSPGTMPESRRKEAQRRWACGFSGHTGRLGHFDCPDKFEMLRWLLAAETESLFTPEHLWLFPVGGLRFHGGSIRRYCGFHLHRYVRRYVCKLSLRLTNSCKWPNYLNLVWSFRKRHSNTHNA